MKGCKLGASVCGIPGRLHRKALQVLQALFFSNTKCVHTRVLSLLAYVHHLAVACLAGCIGSASGTGASVWVAIDALASIVAALGQANRGSRRILLKCCMVGHGVGMMRKTFELRGGRCFWLPWCPLHLKRAQWIRTFCASGSQAKRW